MQSSSSAEADGADTGFISSDVLADQSVLGRSGSLSAPFCMFSENVAALYSGAQDRGEQDMRRSWRETSAPCLMVPLYFFFFYFTVLFFSELLSVWIEV